MSCGVPAEVKELVDQLGVFKKGPIGALDLLPIPIPTTGQGLIEQVKTTNEYAEIMAEVKKIQAKIKSVIPEIDLPVEIKGLQSEVEGIVGEILTAKASAEDLANDLKNLKEKYSGVDLGDLDIEDIPSLLETGILDLENLCKKIPNFEEDGAEIVFRGIPISFPTTSPQSLIKSKGLPDIKLGKIRADIVRRKKQAEDNFINISVPSLFE